METMTAPEVVAEPLRISNKQAEILRVIEQGEASELFLIGAIGTSKTYGMAYAHINIAYQFPKSIIPVGRHNVSEAKIGTFVSYLDMLDMMGLVQFEDYSLRQSPSELSIHFGNRSVIMFVPIDKTKDREWRRLKSINATSSGVDEVDTVQEDGYDTLYSRTGRRNKNGAPALSIATCNPNDGWVKTNIYDKWKAGTLDPKKRVIEFNMEDSFLFESGYYQRFMTRPRPWVERYLLNNWDYMDDDSSLFKMRALDSIMINKITPGTRYISVDPAAEGKDRRVITLWQGDTIVDIRIYSKEDLEALCEPHEKQSPPYGDILARETIRMAQEESVGFEHIGGDVVGNGRAWYEGMTRRGWFVHEFRAGAKPQAGLYNADGQEIGVDYDMLRSQVYHQMALASERHQIAIYNGCPHVGDMRKELLLHRADQSAKILKVESKDLLKKRLGMSPDIADSVVIGFWLRLLTNAAPSSSEHASVGKSVDELYNEAQGF